MGESNDKQRTPSIASLIQEIIGQPGWENGNPLAFVFSGAGKRVAVSHDGAADLAPVLFIAYTLNEGNCPPAGEPCDDGNPATYEDVLLDDNCNCEGLPCPIVGTACDDDNPATFDDREDGFCNCDGTPCPDAGTACDDGKPTTVNDVFVADCNCMGVPLSLSVSPKVYLQGAYNPTVNLMSDRLRANNLLPQTEPYAALGYNHIGGGGETAEASVFETTGPDAIVDWIFLELRDKNDPTIVHATRSALLQADGDMVDTDGASPVTFADLPPDDYYLVVKHRNHLGVMTAAPVALSGTPAIVDFTADLNHIAGGANGIATLPDGKLGMYSGDFNGNGQVQNTDYADMVQTLGTAGYLPGDFDLNGQVQNTDLQFQLLPNIGRGTGVP